MHAMRADIIGITAKRIPQRCDIGAKPDGAMLLPGPARLPDEEDPMTQVEPDVLAFVALIGVLLLLA